MAKRPLTKRPDGWLARAEVDGVEYSRAFTKRHEARVWLSKLDLKKAINEELAKGAKP